MKKEFNTIAAIESENIDEIEEEMEITPGTVTEKALLKCGSKDSLFNYINSTCTMPVLKTEKSIQDLHAALVSPTNYHSSC